jgi:hypothetical protein
MKNGIFTGGNNGVTGAENGGNRIANRDSKKKNGVFWASTMVNGVFIGVLKKMGKRQAFENFGNGNKNVGGTMTNGLLNINFGGNGSFSINNVGNGNENQGGYMTNGMSDVGWIGGGSSFNNIGNKNRNHDGTMNNGIFNSIFNGGVRAENFGNEKFNQNGNMNNGLFNVNYNEQYKTKMQLHNIGTNNTNKDGNSFRSEGQPMMNTPPMSNFNPSQTMQVQTNPNGQDFTSIDDIEQQIRELNEKKKLWMQQQNQNQNNQLFQQKKAQIAQLMKELAQFEQPNNNGYSQ